MEIKFEYAEGKWANCARAISESDLQPSHTIHQEGRSIWHAVTFSQLDQAALFADLLAGIRNRRLAIDGSQIPWQLVSPIMTCIRQRVQSFDPPAYCFGLDDFGHFNPWGCRCLKTPLFYASEIFSIGKWVKKGLFKKCLFWKFDKFAIRTLLDRRLSELPLACPFFNRTFIDAFLMILPDIVGDNDPHWEFFPKDGAGSITRKKWDDVLEKYEEETIFGVCPKNEGSLKEIVEKTIRQVDPKNKALLTALKHAKW